LAGELLDASIQFLKSERPTPETGTLGFGRGQNGVDLLLDGWSVAEPWGVWSERPHAGLRLPVGSKRGRWKVELTFLAFGVNGMIPIEVVEPSESEPIRWEVPANQPIQKEVWIESHLSDATLRFACPKAASPASLGIAEDLRQLGIGLISMELIGPVGE
jgi:hypothetical protein